MRIKDKIEEIEQYLDELMSFLPDNFEEYQTDLQLKAACERYFEKIIEAVIDLAFLVVKEKDLEVPEEEGVVFDILYNREIISRDLCERLKDAKGMRNILAHKYGSINDKIVFHAITEELEKDIRNFLKEIKEKI